MLDKVSVLLAKKALADLRTRSSQVPSESFAPIGEIDYQPVLVTIQEHRANRAGLHYDLRIVLPDRALSFVIPWSSLKQAPGTLASWIRQPDHVPEYAGWEGEIPEGEYGAGSVRVVYQSPGVLSSKPDGSLDLSYGSKNEWGRFTISPPQKDGQQYFAISRNLPQERYWQERPQYKLYPEGKPTEGLIASIKEDGALVYMVPSAKGITVTSRRRSTKDGKLLVREHHVPWIRDQRLPKKYQGLVLAAELVHPRGFTFVGPLMNSSPERAVELQQRAGRMYAVPHNIYGTSMTYGEKKALLDQLIADANNPYIKPATFGTPEEIWEQAQREGREGEILVDPNDPESQMYKRKLWDTYTGQVVDIIPSAKRPGTIGAMLVRDAEGNVVRVGSGEGMSLAMRKQIMENRQKYLGKKVRVLAHGSTGTSLRQPRWGGWAMRDDPLDSFRSTEMTYSEMFAGGM